MKCYSTQKARTKAIEDMATVVFADTRGKARAMALHTECCEDADFCSIEVHRQPQMDKFYTDGKRELDWEDSQDRIALVKDCGFSCSEDCFDIDDCGICPAKEYCDRYIDYEEEWSDTE